jgi:hypothetical protein
MAFSDLINLVTDGYDRKARFYPALLLVAPVIVVGVAMLSVKLSALESFGALLVGFGDAFLLTQLARDAGKKGEKELFAKWGGMPSVSIFRHRDTRLDGITKARYHKKLAGLVKNSLTTVIGATCGGFVCLALQHPFWLAWLAESVFTLFTNRPASSTRF